MQLSGRLPRRRMVENNMRSDRIDSPVRYSLILSLRTPEQSIDLYTPIATQLQVPIETEVVVQ
ncbi:hypothetical protein [Nocardia fluminea]|uniref:hypothetical protein n=1 Tax=Nocardia fluminea TaxID=134984 RepID=UPI0033F93132